MLYVSLSAIYFKTKHVQFTFSVHPVTFKTPATPSENLSANSACYLLNFCCFFLGQSPVEETKPVITHVKARTGKYPGSDVERFHVPDDKAPWTVEFEDYSPVEYTVPKILNDKPEWADPDTRYSCNFRDLTTVMFMLL